MSIFDCHLVLEAEIKGSRLMVGHKVVWSSTPIASATPSFWGRTQNYSNVDTCYVACQVRAHARGVVDHGSVNLNWRSFLYKDEIRAVHFEQDCGAQMSAMFEKDQAESEIIGLEQWEQRSPNWRVKESLARLWQRAHWDAA